MGRIILFTADDCHFCHRAKTELRHRCLPFVEISLTKFPQRRVDMQAMSGKLTVPQVFFNCRLVGGCDDMMDLFDRWDSRCEGRPSGAFWQIYVQEVSARPDPADPRLAHPMTPLGLTDEFDIQPLQHSSNSNSNSHRGRTAAQDEHADTEDDPIGCIPLPDGTYADIADVTSKLIQKMPRQKLAYLAKFYTDCFPGDLGVDTLLTLFPALSSSSQDIDLNGHNARKRAVEFGQLLQRCGVLHHVCNERDFQDSKNFYYRLQPYHQPHVLNSFQSEHQVAMNLPAQLNASATFQDDDTTLSDPHIFTASGSHKVLAKLQTLLADIEVRATGRDGIDFLTAKNYNDPAYVQLEEGSCRMQCMDGISLACTMTDAEKMVFGIQLYNVMVRHANIKLGVPSTASQRRAFFTGVNYKVANQLLSLDDVEHGMLRANVRHPYHLKPQFVGEDPRRSWAVSKLDPRVHFTLYCGANSCPPINNYTVDNLEKELQMAAESFCLDDSNVVVDENNNTLTLSMIFKWYKSDFGCSSSKGLPDVVLGYLPENSEKYASLTAMILSASKTGIKVKFMPYDWAPQAAPGKFLIFRSSALKTCETSLRAPFSKVATAGLTYGGRPKNRRNAKGGNRSEVPKRQCK